MVRVLLTGVSGVGKSAVVSALAARGFRAVDTDYGGYCAPAADIDPPVATAQPGWVWHEARIRSLLDGAAGEALFVSGCVPNQGRFYGDFVRPRGDRLPWASRRYRTVASALRPLTIACAHLPARVSLGLHGNRVPEAA